VTSLKGKILRIDVNGDDFPADAERNYAIPPTNPFAAGGGAPEVFALGLRHPFRNGFDSETGDLYIADVGSQYYEEVNYLPAGNGGQNFGWRPREGFFDQPQFSDPSPPGAKDPVHAYPIGSAAAIIGGPVYRGSAMPWLDGTYFFTDFEKRQVWSFRYDGTVMTDFIDRTAELASPLGSYGGVASFAEDGAGEMYMIDYLRGDLYKIVAATPEEYGDFNENGVVDAADYVAWRKNVPGTYDETDYNNWVKFFGGTLGASSGSGGSNGSSIPEPHSLGALFLGVLLATRRHRTRR
jgi:hypothetical protein